jgi:hypothetical protein
LKKTPNYQGRIFDILVDDELVNTQDLNKYKGSRFYGIHYAISTTLANGKEKATIWLKAKTVNSVGPVYGTVRMASK